jgi:hypothetical protein
MIPVIDEPMESVDIDVQDHARRTGTILDQYTQGDDQFEPPWGSKAHQVDVETPSGGIDMTEMDQKLCTGEEEDVPPEAPWQSLTKGDWPFLSGTLAMEGLGRHP